MADIPRPKHTADLPAHLAAVLAAGPRPVEYLLAVSGGADSLALMFLFEALGGAVPAPWRVVHVDHGLDPGSGRWAAHVAALCRKIDVPCEIHRVQVTAGESGLEAAARQARYAALAAAMRPGTTLLTAHHLDDQAETVLLRLLRGAGVRGLAAIPPLCRFGPGHLARPLLAVPRRLLCAWLKSCGVEWIEDSANLDPKHDRNYLRHRIMPELHLRWPAAAASIAASAGHCREAEALLAGYDRAGLAAARKDDGLDLTVLAGLPAGQGRRVVRLWLERQGLAPPPARRLEVFLEQALAAAADRCPALDWTAGRLSRYRSVLYFIPAGGWAAAIWEGGARRWDDPAKPFQHPAIGTLTLTGPPPAAWPALWVDLRRGGERLAGAPDRPPNNPPPESGELEDSHGELEDSHEFGDHEFGDSHNLVEFEDSHDPGREFGDSHDMVREKRRSEQVRDSHHRSLKVEFEDSHDPGREFGDSHDMVREKRRSEQVRDSHHRSLKKWFQAAGEPPWRRAHWPLLYHDAGAAGRELWAAGDRLLAPGCRDWLAATGLELNWRPPWAKAPGVPLPPTPDLDDD